MSTQLRVSQAAYGQTGEMLGPDPSPVETLDQQTTTREVQLLLLCARTEVDGETAGRIRLLASENLDWTFVVKQAEQHRVTPLLCRTLSKVCPELVPSDVLKDLHDYTSANAHYNLYRTGELIKLLRLFEANSIPALPFKGPVLSASAYGNLALREYGDLDILVRPSDVTATIDLLLSSGYSLVKSLRRTQTNLRFAARNKDLIFDSADGRVRVELHWRLTGRHFDFPLDLESMWRELDEVSLAGSTVRTLAPQDLLLYLCMHGSRHSWERLLWICDVAQLLRSYPQMDWDSVNKKAAQLGAKRTLALGMLLARDLLGAELPEEVWRKFKVEPAMTSLALRLKNSLFGDADDERGISYWHEIHTHMRERATDRLRLHLHYYFRYLRVAVVPNERDYAIMELPRPLSFFYYLIRPLRLLKSLGAPKRRKDTAGQGEADCRSSL